MEISYRCRNNCICSNLIFMILFSGGRLGPLTVWASVSVTADVPNAGCTNAGLLWHAWSRPFKR